ncbi:ThiF family adenylyltransferase [Corynebacterium alimapuense]|uniref:Molybdopterin biosynthesis protein MoeB n=1 Tax=Corynebacterium alimapuense TaxID=1576874 RepID=A0A3M8K647_9CORY|nr:ThiF family adenylyltransferase [Corynebacterium alimapuense]RNE48225.1 molybdopterin biosynthesis protein MoeB [Corynebacterium alimapuense]
MSLSPEQNSRYRRQLSLGGFGPESQEALLGAHVAVIGAGGLGSPALLYLAGAGVGHITIIDDDDVDLSNLHRQVIHDTAGIGSPKARSAREKMLALNPGITVEARVERLERSTAVDLLQGADLVVDGSDNFDTRHLVSYACARLQIPHVWASILGFDAQLSVFHAGHGPVYEDLFPAPPAPGEVPSCAQAGVLGPVVGVVGSAMAMEAIKLLTGIGDPLIGTLGYFSSLSGQWEYLPIVGSPASVARLLAEGPPVQARGSSAPEVDEIRKIPANALLIDVREPEEFQSFRIPGAVNVPLGEILAGRNPAEMNASGQVVIYCAGGVRSAKAVAALSERGISGLVSLAGGIEAWLDQRA